MADADDFDVEYFRSLLKGGGGPKEEPRADAAQPARKAAAKRPAARAGGPGKGSAGRPRKKA